MFEIITKINGKEVPQLVIVDESVRGKYVEALKKKKIKYIYIGNGCGCEKGMSDEEIMELGRTLGYIPIATCNPEHFRFYEKEGGVVIKLKQMDSMYEYLRRTREAGINVEGKLFV